MKISLLLALLVWVSSCSHFNIEEKELIYPTIPDIYILRSSPILSIENDTVFILNKRFSGYLIDLYENSRDTLAIRGYVNGVQNGKETKWYPDQQLMEERSYLNGRKNGKQIAYWENGLKKFEFIAKNDAYEGELKEWNREGKLIHLANYKDGQEEGAQKMWYDNGKIRANYVIIEGKRYGLLGTKNCTNVSDSVFVAN